jgi:hypothetical protein
MFYAERLSLDPEFNEYVREVAKEEYHFVGFLALQVCLDVMKLPYASSTNSNFNPAT